MFGGLATVVFLGSQYNNQTIRKENKLLNEKISTISQRPLTSVVTDTIYIRQNDTVFTTRYVTRYVRVADEYVEDENSASRNKSGILAEKTKYKLNEQKNADGKMSLDPKSKGESGNKKSDNSAAADLVEKLTTNKVASDKNLAETNLAFQANQQVDKVVAEVTDEKPKTLKVEDTSVPEVEELKKEQKQAEELIIPENTAMLPTDRKKPKKIDLSRIDARFGILGDYMGHQFNSLGPAIEVFLGERFALNTGLLITGKHEYQYRMLRDFNMITGKKFEDRYEPFIKNKPMKIENIEIETSSIKLLCANQRQIVVYDEYRYKTRLVGIRNSEV
jgi:hypothetical protein